MQEQIDNLASSGGRGDTPGLAHLWGWLLQKRWWIDTNRVGEKPHVEKRVRFSYWALLLILVVTRSWSYIIQEAISPSDAVRYYHFLKDGSWLQKYYLEQVMFWVMTVAHPTTFSKYLFISSSIPLCILLYSFYRLKYTRTDQFLLILFFSCSFYGVHFVVTFQRQFYALAFFVLALSIGKSSILARSASLFSHLYAIVLHLFWELRRLSPRAIALIVIAIIPIMFFSMQRISADAVEHYAAGGESSASALALKEGLNLVYTVIIIYTARRGGSVVKSISVAFAVFAVPALFWSAYAGVFVRFDYYFFPLMIALWPTCLDRRHRALFRATLLFSTITGFALWMILNFRWVVTGIA